MIESSLFSISFVAKMVNGQREGESERRAQELWVQEAWARNAGPPQWSPLRLPPMSHFSSGPWLTLLPTSLK